TTTERARAGEVREYDLPRLSDIRRAVAGIQVGRGDPEVTGIAYDSRQVKPGDLFVCVHGFKTDGRQYLPEAVRRGAAAAFWERPETDDRQIRALRVPPAGGGMARAAWAFYADPSRELSLVGVTGTNGKTTTTSLVESILGAAGTRTGVIGTIGCRIGSEP